MLWSVSFLGKLDFPAASLPVDIIDVGLTIFDAPSLRDVLRPIHRIDLLRSFVLSEQINRHVDRFIQLNFISWLLLLRSLRSRSFLNVFCFSQVETRSCRFTLFFCNRGFVDI